MRIVVLDDYADAFRHSTRFGDLAGHDVAIFQDTAKREDDLVERLADADAVVLIQQRSVLSAAVIRRLPRLRFISQTGRNVYHVATEACAAQGIVISAGGAGKPSVIAEFTWGLILAALRHIPDEAANLKAGGWQRTIGTGLEGKTLGIYACGRIGSLVANAGAAFGMRVVCFGRDGSTAKARAAGREVATSREAFFAESDVLTLHLALNAETRGIVTAVDLARMKPTALLVNTSRAGIVETGALAAALTSGRPGRAAIDVFHEEPVIGAADPLIGHPNVLATPHLGYVEEGTYESLFGTAIAQLLGYLQGQPINLVTTVAG